MAGDQPVQGQRLGPSRQVVESRITALIHEIAGIPTERIVAGATVDEELRMESVAFVELQVAIEDEYNIQIDPIQVVELNEFGAIVDYIYDCVANSAQ